MLDVLFVTRPKFVDVGSASESLGPEPLSRQFTAEALTRSAAESRQPAKLFLMDQRRIAGLGNIYAAEALMDTSSSRFPSGYRCPSKPCLPQASILGSPSGSISRPRLRALHAAIIRILRDAVKSACRAYSRPGGFQ